MADCKYIKPLLDTLCNLAQVYGGGNGAHRGLVIENGL